MFNALRGYVIAHYIEGVSSSYARSGQDRIEVFVRDRDSMTLPYDSFLIRAATEGAYGSSQSSFETEEEAYYILEPFLKRWEAGECDGVLEGIQFLGGEKTKRRWICERTHKVWVLSIQPNMGKAR